MSSLEQRLEELSTLNAIGDILNAEADFSVALKGALERLVDLLGLEAGWVFLTRVSQGDAHQGSFRVAAMTGLPPALSRDKAAPLCGGSCDCQWRFRQGKLDRGVNIVHCSRLESAQGNRGGLELHASLPLLGQTGPVGILNLAAPGSERFDADTLAFLSTVGRQLGTAFERSKLQVEREREARYAATLEERQRLATEIHDSVTQLLFGAELALEVAREAQEPRRGHSLARGAELLSSALGELRGLVEVLRPADLSHDLSQGLSAALARLAERTQGTRGTKGALRVQLEAEPLSLPNRHAQALYRVAQEALHNALRHAEANNIWLRLVRADAEVTLSVEDDGRGLAAEMEPGLGLRSMRTRAESLGGTLELTPRQPSGLRLRVTLPCGYSG